jgi:hypothetical protein
MKIFEYEQGIGTTNFPARPFPEDLAREYP